MVGGEIMSGFSGVYHRSLDRAGRLSLPRAFRAVLAEEDPAFGEGRDVECVLFYGGEEPFLQFFSHAAMDEIHRKICDLPRGSRDRWVLNRWFVGQTLRAALDARGRVTLPAWLRKRRGFPAGSDVVVVGKGNSFQLWHAAAYGCGEGGDGIGGDAPVHETGEGVRAGG